MIEIIVKQIMRMQIKGNNEMKFVKMKENSKSKELKRRKKELIEIIKNEKKYKK